MAARSTRSKCKSRQKYRHFSCLFDQIVVANLYLKKKKNKSEIFYHSMPFIIFFYYYERKKKNLKQHIARENWAHLVEKSTKISDVASLRVK